MGAAPQARYGAGRKAAKPDRFYAVTALPVDDRVRLIAVVANTKGVSLKQKATGTLTGVVFVARNGQSSRHLLPELLRIPSDDLAH